MHVPPCLTLRPGVHPQCQHRSGCRHHRCSVRHVSACGQAGVGWLQIGHTGTPSSSSQAQFAQYPLALLPACSLGAAPGWVSGRSQLTLDPLDPALPGAPARRMAVSGPSPLQPALTAAGLWGAGAAVTTACHPWVGGGEAVGLDPGARTVAWPERPSQPPTHLPSLLRQGRGAEGDLDTPPGGARARRERLLFTVS